jgi:hypothetical protein
MVRTKRSEEVMRRNGTRESVVKRDVATIPAGYRVFPADRVTNAAVVVRVMGFAISFCRYSLPVPLLKSGWRTPAAGVSCGAS